MKIATGLLLSLLLAGCAAPETFNKAQDHSRYCRQVAYELSLEGTPDEQGLYQICMRNQGYGVIPKIRSSGGEKTSSE